MKKHLLPSSLLTCLGLCLFLSACSLQDHVLPEKLVIKTESVQFNNGWDFTIQVDTLGTAPISEHGILFLSFFRASNDVDYNPRIEHGTRIKFDSPLVEGANKFKYTGDGFAGRYFFYYRAYAILSDGSVVYGNLRSYTF